LKNYTKSITTIRVISGLSAEEASQLVEGLKAEAKSKAMSQYKTQLKRLS
jgi:hypothetical protein